MHSALGTASGIRTENEREREERNEDSSPSVAHRRPFRRRCRPSPTVPRRSTAVCHISNEQVANSSMDSIKTLAAFPHGMEIIIPVNKTKATHPEIVASTCSSLHHYLEEESSIL
uniref:Uncharacterized protein n=1 Tax=Cucumis melo TaxID=3656 RepID=A0A9I9EI18_CUCME